MGYQVDVEEYGTVSLEKGVGTEVRLDITDEGETQTRFVFSQTEFQTFLRAIRLVQEDLAAEDNA